MEIPKEPRSGGKNGERKMTDLELIFLMAAIFVFGAINGMAIENKFNESKDSRMKQIYDFLFKKKQSD